MQLSQAHISEPLEMLAHANKQKHMSQTSGFHRFLHAMTCGGGWHCQELRNQIPGLGLQSWPGDAKTERGDLWALDRLWGPQHRRRACMGFLSHGGTGQGES